MPFSGREGGKVENSLRVKLYRVIQGASTVSVMFNFTKNKFGSHIYNKWLVSRICKELWRFNSKKTNNLFRVWAKHLNRSFTKEDLQTAVNTEPRSHRQPLGRCELKPQGSITLRLSEWLKWKAVTTANASEGGSGETGLFKHGLWAWRVVHYSGKQTGSFLQN